MKQQQTNAKSSNIMHSFNQLPPHYFSKSAR